jgi:hypothetical protein
MSARPLSAHALLPLVALAVGCGSKPSVPPATPSASELPPAPPPKKCEAIDEQCKAESGTRARIAHATFAFTPVAGWFYAQGDVATIAQAADNGPATAFGAFDVDPKKEQASRETAFESLLKELKIGPPKTKVQWKHGEAKPVAQIKAGAFWQIDLVNRAEKKGPLVVFDAPLPDGKELMGIGFVPDDDKGDSDEAILKSIDSIAPAAAGSAPAAGAAPASSGDPK